jgi:hypothetical protein
VNLNQRIEGKEELTFNDKMLLDLIKSDIKRYKIVVDNDNVWVEDQQKDDIIVGDFSSYGDELIISILEYIGISVEYC